MDQRYDLIRVVWFSKKKLKIFRPFLRSISLIDPILSKNFLAIYVKRKFDKTSMIKRQLVSGRSSECSDKFFKTIIYENHQLTR